MDTGVLVALITSVTSLGVALGSVWLQQRGTRATREETRRSEEKVVLDRYRQPLLTAASELGRRIDNIRCRGFLAFSAPGNDRESAAKLTTMFRFAQYLGWREVLRDEVQLMRFATEESTRDIADLLGYANSAPASDRLDGGRAMLWLEEQRAVGELMVRESGGKVPSRCIGYAGFVGDYDTTFRPWIDGFGRDVMSPDALESDRLRLLQWSLAGLVILLDEEGVHRDHPWIRKVSAEVESAPTGPSTLEATIVDRLRSLRWAG